MYSTKMHFMWDYAYSGLYREETGRNAKICVLEEASIKYEHPYINFSRQTPNSPGNSSTIKEPSISAAQKCSPIFCTSNTNCLGVQGKNQCHNGRCASGATCSSNSNCNLYGESCQGGKCQENCPNSMNAYDISISKPEHATQVAGVINTYSSAYSYFGGAPSAVIYSANTNSINGYFDGFLWCSKKEVDVVNQSFIYFSMSATSGSISQNNWSRLADWYSEYKNMLIIGGAGNAATGGSNPYTENVTYNGLTVGAYSHNGTEAWDDDFLLSFSNKKNPSTTYGDLMKPDVLAPGDDIYSTTITGTIPWDKSTGTSVATPFVSSLAAQIVSWGNENKVNGVNFFQGKPQLLKAIVKNSSCNRLTTSGYYSDYEIGQGGINAYLTYNTLNTWKYVSNFVGHIFLDVTQDFETNGFYKWGQGGRPSLLCYPVAPLQIIRFTFAWETHVNGTATSPTYGYFPDFDAYLYRTQDLDSNNNPQNYPIAYSSRWDNTTEILQWTNYGSSLQNVCVQFYKYQSPSQMDYSIRLGWSAAVVPAQKCDSYYQ